MATPSLSLSPHWEAFVQSEVASGRYASASEVVRDGLRARSGLKRPKANNQAAIRNCPAQSNQLT